MRRLRLAVVGLLGAALSIAAVPGCRAPTEVTLDIGLAGAKCSEIHGTAITVGVDPSDTEKRVTEGYLSASTVACDPVVGHIGTLVVTPNDDMRAAVVVVVAYGDHNDPATCKPPDYAGCIVARRSFSFVEHTGLFMPITIDPDCVNVPCDAFSTCRNGQCYASTPTCGGADCNEPGSLPDGGTDEGGVVTPDSGREGGVIDGGDGGVPKVPYCDSSETLHCHGASAEDVTCGAPSVCCDQSSEKAKCNPAAQCPDGPARYCCTKAECGGNPCFRLGNSQEAGRCPNADAGTDPDSGAPAVPYCEDPGTGAPLILHCDSPVGADVQCKAPSACCANTYPYQCSDPNTCTGKTRYCCTSDDCGGSPCMILVHPSLQTFGKVKVADGFGTCSN